MAVNVIAQTTNAASKMNAVYSSQELSAMAPDQKAQLSHFSTDGYAIIDLNKGAEYALLSSVIDPRFAKSINYKNLNKDNFNPLMLRSGLDRTNHLFFVIDGTNKVVEIYSTRFANRRYEQFKTEQNNKKKQKK